MLKSGLWTDLKLFSITLMASRIHGNYFALDFFTYPSCFLCNTLVQFFFTYIRFWNCRKEFIQPLKICIFYSQKSLIQGAENPLHRVHSRFYANFKEVCPLVFNCLLSNTYYHYENSFYALAGDCVTKRTFLGYCIVCGWEVEFGWTLLSQELPCSSQLLRGFLTLAVSGIVN